MSGGGKVENGKPRIPEPDNGFAVSARVKAPIVRAAMRQRVHHRTDGILGQIVLASITPAIPHISSPPSFPPPIPPIALGTGRV